MKLEHISGDNLKELQGRLEDLGPSVKQVVGVNFNKTWFIHFVVEQQVDEKKPEGKKNASKPKTV